MSPVVLEGESARHQFPVLIFLLLLLGDAYRRDDTIGPQRWDVQSRALPLANAYAFSKTFIKGFTACV